MTTSTSHDTAAPAGHGRTTHAAADTPLPLPTARGALLADALSLNVLLSAATGSALLVVSPWLDTVIGGTTPVLALLGAGLLGFAAAILAALTRPTTLRRDASLVVVADLLWIGATPIVLTADVLTTTGETALLVTTALVAVVVVAQLVGLVRSRGLERPGVRPLLLTGRRDVDASPERAWTAVADAAGYASFAPGIAAVRTDGPVADGMQRVCTDDAGDEWRESCSLVEPGRAYRMTVDTSTYPWRLRVVLDSFGMAWRVTPRDGGSALELSFGGGVLLGVLGRLAVRAWTSDDPVGTVLGRYAAALDHR